MSSLPKSASSLSINLVGVASYALVMIATLYYDPEIGFVAFFLRCMLAIAVPVVLLELLVLRVHKRPRVGWLAVKDPADNARVRLKVIGLNAT